MLPSALTDSSVVGTMRVLRVMVDPPPPQTKKDIEARCKASEQRGLPQACLQNEMGGERWGAPRR